MVLEPAISAAISLTLLAGATIPITLARRRGKRERRISVDKTINPRVTNDEVESMIRCGTAYAIDSGKTIVIVISFSKEPGESACEIGGLIPVTIKPSEEAEVST